MEAELRKFLFDPTVGKIVALVVGAVIIAMIGRIAEEVVREFVPGLKSVRVQMNATISWPTGFWRTTDRG